MTRYKNMNSIKKFLISHHPKQEIHKVRFSRRMIRAIFDNYLCIEYCVYHYCCKGEDNNCWIDEDIGWMDGAPEERSQRAMKQLFSVMKGCRNPYKLNLYTIKSEKGISIAVPLRDRFQCDIYLSFQHK